MASAKTLRIPSQNGRAYPDIRAGALFLALAFVATGQTPPLHKVTIPHDTFLTFKTVGRLDSGTAKVGDDVPLRLLRPLIIRRAAQVITVLPEGAEVHGRVARVKHAGRNKTAAGCGDGWLAIDVQRIVFPDHSAARVQTVGQHPAGGPFPVTMSLAQADWWTLTHPKDSLSSNLGPVPLMFVAATPLVAAKEGIEHSLVNPILDLATISKRNQPCRSPVHESVVPPGSPVTVLMISSHTVRL